MVGRRGPGLLQRGLELRGSHVSSVQALDRVFAILIANTEVQPVLNKKRNSLGIPRSKKNRLAVVVAGVDADAHLQQLFANIIRRRIPERRIALVVASVGVRSGRREKLQALNPIMRPGLQTGSPGR